MIVIESLDLLNISQSEDGTCVGWNLGPKFGGFLGDGTSDGAAFGLAFVVDDHSCVVFAVQEGSVRSVPCSSLSDYNSGVHFLSEFLDSLFDWAENYISDGSGGESVEMSSDSLNGDDVEILSSWVICAVEGGGDG